MLVVSSLVKGTGLAPDVDASSLTRAWAMLNLAWLATSISESHSSMVTGQIAQQIIAKNQM